MKKDTKYKYVDSLIETRDKLVRIKSKTGYRGITEDRRPGRTPYISRFTITHGDKQVSIHLGTYDTAEEAYIARLKFIDTLK